jgi:hypothetical protein
VVVALNARAINDPLKTREVRERYFRQIRARLRRARRVILGILNRADASAFGPPSLPGAQGPPITLVRNAEEDLSVDVRIGAGAFEAVALGRTKEFQLLLEEIIQELLIHEGIEELASYEVAEYAERAIEQAYQIGVSFAARHAASGTPSQKAIERLRRALVKLPTHRGAARALGRMQVQRLSGLSVDVAIQIREAVENAIDQRYTRDQVAALIDKIFGIGETRAKTIAYTEVTKAHAQGALNAYRSMRFEQVRARVEFTLNVHGDAAPCPRCIALEDKRYTLDQAVGVIPVHPNCQCGWTPVEIEFGDDKRTGLTAEDLLEQIQ